jgi:ornithine cyclodeaminase/alanine dehydrogenase-like protein (mu-crystallin family)
MAVKVVTLFEANADVGVPAHLATIGLYDPQTGVCRAFMDPSPQSEGRPLATNLYLSEHAVLEVCKA